MKRTIQLGVVVCGLAAAGLASAQSNTFGATPKDQTGVNPIIESVTFNTPHDVVQYRVVGSGASSISIATQDCCIVGDKWSVRVVDRSNGKITDVRGVGSGSTSAFSGGVTLYRGGSQEIDAIVEIRYNQGVSQFGAGMSVRFEGNPASATLTTTQITTPLPLMSQ